MTIDQLPSAVDRDFSTTFRQTLLTIPPNFFAIPFGLAGLAAVWRYANAQHIAPRSIGEALFVLAAVTFVLLTTALLTKLVVAPRLLRADLTNPIKNPFTSLFPISGMLLALGLVPYAHIIATMLFFIFFTATWLLGGWLTGQWIVGKHDADFIHPGYLLPTVAGGLVAANGAATLGFSALGWLSFGLGIVCWLMLGSVVLNRLFSRPQLPAALVPTLVVELGPPAVAGNAYFVLNGNKIDMLAYVLAGYVILMLLVQIRLVPLYYRTPFAPSFWSFTFPLAATASYTLHWLALLQPMGAILLSWIVLAMITLLIGGIATRSIIGLWHGTFLPKLET